MHDDMIPHQHREARNIFPADAREQAWRLLLNDGFNDFYAGIFRQPAAFLNLEIPLVNTQDEMLLHYPRHSIQSVRFTPRWMRANPNSTSGLGLLSRMRVPPT